MTNVAPTQFEVYGLSCTCHPERGVRYVGLTTQGHRNRMRQHVLVAVGKDPRYARSSVCMWIRKHGGDNIASVLIQSYPNPEAMNDGEKFHIARFRALGLADLNMNDGGSGNPGVIYSDETRARMSASAKKRGVSDAVRRSARERKGELSPRAKSTAEQVRQMREMLWSGLTLSEVSERFGVSLGNVAHIDKHRSWTDVPWPIGPRQRPRTRERQAAQASKRRHTPEELEKMSRAISAAYTPERREKARLAKLGKRLPQHVIIKIGETNSKMTASEVRFVRDAISWGLTRSEVIGMFPDGYLSISTYHRIKQGKAYHWVD